MCEACRAQKMIQLFRELVRDLSRREGEVCKAVFADINFPRFLSAWKKLSPSVFRLD
jgi:hypothetical protein